MNTSFLRHLIKKNFSPDKVDEVFSIFNCMDPEKIEKVDLLRLFNISFRDKDKLFENLELAVNDPEKFKNKCDNLESWSLALERLKTEMENNNFSLGPLFQVFLQLYNSSFSKNVKIGRSMNRLVFFKNYGDLPDFFIGFDFENKSEKKFYIESKNDNNEYDLSEGTYDEVLKKLINFYK